jgi:hypothetical protein
VAVLDRIATKSAVVLATKEKISADGVVRTQNTPDLGLPRRDLSRGGYAFLMELITKLKHEI